MKMIIMAGGSGTRLWPLSRTYFPKQFVKLAGMECSIFQSTLKRCLLMGEADDIFVVTSKDYLHLIQRQSDEIGIDLPEEHILLEPQAKNTLPAILYAVQAIQETGDNICAVFASDHVIDEPQLLADTILESQELAGKGLVCFGITPDAPETGYGYIKPGKPVQNTKGIAGQNVSQSETMRNDANISIAYEITEFKEKPDLDAAKEYLKAGYLWNSGMFMFHSAQFTEAVKKHNPDVFNAFQAKTIEEKFKRTPAISVDYGLVERLERSFVVPLPMKWGDAGSFTSFYDRYKAIEDERGNILLGDEIMLDCSNNLVYSEVEKAIAVIGISDIVVVDIEDALLICHRDQTQKVKEVTDILRKKNDPRV